MAKLKNVSWTSFQAGKAKERGALKFDLELNLAAGLDFLPKLEIKNVLLRADGKLEFDGQGGGDQVRGRQGAVDRHRHDRFRLHKYRLSYNPGKRTGTIGSSVVPNTKEDTAGDKGIRLDVDIQLSFPVKEVHITGTAYAAGQTVGTVDGRISDKMIDFDLTVPGKPGPLERVVKGKMHTHLDRTGLTGSGEALFFSGLKATVDLVIKFNGPGQLRRHRVGELRRPQGRGHPVGQLRPRLPARDHRRAPHAGPRPGRGVGDRRDRGECVHRPDRRPVLVTARAMGLEVTFAMAGFDKLDLEAVRRELKKAAHKFVERVEKCFADGEKHGRELAAKWEKDVRKSIYEAAKSKGLDRLSTPNPYLNKILGDASQDLKDAGGKASDYLKDKSRQPFQRAEGDRLRPDRDDRRPPLSGSWPLMQFDLRAPDPPKLGLSLDERRALQAERRLAKVVEALNKVRSTRPRSRRGSKPEAAHGELRVRVRHCTSAADGKDGAVLAFTLQAGGFRHDAQRPQRRQAGRQVGSEGRRGPPAGVFGKGKPQSKSTSPSWTTAPPGRPRR